MNFPQNLKSNKACRISHKMQQALSFYILMNSAQCLHLFRCQRNLLTQAARSRFGNQIILLIADATEIAVFFHLYHSQ